MPLTQDLKYSFRLLARNRGFTALAVLTLALGIGATSAVFSVLYGVLLRPLPYSQPDRLMTLQATFPRGHNESTDGARATFWKQNQRMFESVAIIGSGNAVNLESGSGVEHIQTSHVSADFFRVLRVKPALGRTFSPGEDQRGAAPVTVLSFGLWQRRFGGSRDILGRGITLGDQSYTIVGVAPPGMDSVLAADAWIPLYMSNDFLFGGWNYLFLGRLKDGISFSEANADARLLAGEFRQANPKAMRSPQESAGLYSLASTLTSNAKAPLTGMLAAVGLVLLIACVNVANLLLGMFSRRRREIALRLAVGAERHHILRQLLTESLCLSLAGGALGLALARLLVGAIVKFRPVHLPRLDEVSLDPKILLFTLAVAVGTGILFGLAPALQTIRTDVLEGLQEAGSRSSAGRGGKRLRESLVSIEFALSMVLLIGAGLLIESFIRLNLVDPGFDPAHVLTLQVTLTGKRYQTSEQVARFTQEVSDRLRQVPGAMAAATSNYLPLGRGFNIPLQRIEGRPVHLDEFLGNLEWFGITPGFFDVLRTHVVAGRAFRDSDTAASAPVVIVNSAFARKYFPRRNALGQRITIAWEGDPAREIVGITNDIHEMGLGTPAQPDVFVPITQVSGSVDAEVNPIMPTTLMVRTSGDPMAVSRQAADEIHTIDPLLPVFHIRSMSQVAGDSVQQNRFLASLLGGFAALALLLAAVGIYGVMAHAVAERTKEFGIRSALGAQPGTILQMVIRQGMMVAAIGMIAGAAAAFAVTRLLSRFLFGVTARDPLVMACAPLVLLLAALLACYVPARRGLKVDPITALRYE